MQRPLRDSLPVRDALFDTDESLRTRLRTHGDQFQDRCWRQLDDKAEWGVKALLRSGETRTVTFATRDSSVSSWTRCHLLWLLPARPFSSGKNDDELVKATLRRPSGPVCRADRGGVADDQRPGADERTSCPRGRRKDTA